MIELLKPYRHKKDPGIGAVPFNVVDDQVEITLDHHGTLDTGAMSIADFLEQFERQEADA